MYEGPRSLDGQILLKVGLRLEKLLTGEAGLDMQVFQCVLWKGVNGVLRGVKEWGEDRVFTELRQERLWEGGQT